MPDITVLVREAFTLWSYFMIELIVFLMLPSSVLVALGRWFIGKVFALNAGRVTLGFRILTFPGVLYHELCHAFFAMISGAKIKRIRFTRTGGVTTVIAQGPAWLRDTQFAVSSVGPVIGGLFALLCLYYERGHFTGAWEVLAIYIAVTVFLHSAMSRQDMKVFIKGLPGFLFFTFACCLLCTLLPRMF